jgi:superfamily II DNA or RNA helicase
LSIIKEVINKVDHNILILVEKVEKEGQFLKDWLTDLVKKEIVFLSGRDDVEEREKWRKRCENRNDIVLIATYGIFSTGINIPNIKYMILDSPV